MSFSLGACAGVKVHLRSGEPIAASNGIDVALGAKREQARTPELFATLNIDPSAKKILVVKSTQHFFPASHPSHLKFCTRAYQARWRGT